jgi:hypothetical protein
MTYITTFQSIQDLQASGNAVEAHLQGVASGTTTAGAAASGYATAHALFNNLGTTLASTLQGFPMQAGISSKRLRLIYAQSHSNRAVSSMICNLYLVGTINFTATGQRLTHNAATFPLLRTRMGQASQPWAGIPFLYMTAATATTAPVFTMDYVDAAGTSKTGTRTTTLPAAITTQNSCFFPPLENDTTGVRDVSAVNVTVAATAGTANLYLLENLCFTTTPVLNMPGVFDGVYTGFSPPRLDPAVATSGTVSYVTTIVSLATSSTDTGTAYIKAVVES